MKGSESSIGSKVSSTQYSHIPLVHLRAPAPVPICACVNDACTCVCVPFHPKCLWTTDVAGGIKTRIYAVDCVSLPNPATSCRSSILLRWTTRVHGWRPEDFGNRGGCVCVWRPEGLKWAVELLSASLRLPVTPRLLPQGWFVTHKYSTRVDAVDVRTPRSPVQRVLFEQCILYNSPVNWIGERVDQEKSASKDIMRHNHYLLIGTTFFQCSLAVLNWVRRVRQWRQTGGDTWC